MVAIAAESGEHSDLVARLQHQSKEVGRTCSHLTGIASDADRPAAFGVKPVVAQVGKGNVAGTEKTLLLVIEGDMVENEGGYLRFFQQGVVDCAIDGDEFAAGVVIGQLLQRILDAVEKFRPLAELPGFRNHDEPERLARHALRDSIDPVVHGPRRLQNSAAQFRSDARFPVQSFVYRIE